MEQKAISSDLIRGHIDTIILHSLTSGDKFAQQISDFVEEKSGKEYKINQATLYSSLKRLETLKHVTSYWYDSSVGGRRKYFRLTELGKQTVETNLSDWSYSRAIIDKLIDCSPQPTYETKIVEKIVEVPVEKKVYVVSNPVQTQQPESVQSLGEQQTQKTENFETKTKGVSVDANAEQKTESSNELNFRNILSGLIKSTVVHKQTVQELQPLKKDNSEPKLNFNETIASNDYGSQKVINTGKIDFGDLIIKAAKEGYKLRVSSKESGIAPGKLLVNKLNLFSALSIYLIVLLEFLILSSSYGVVMKLSVGTAIGTISALTVFPIIRLLQFVKNPTKKSSKDISADKILTTAIVVFNLLVVTLAANLLFNVSFTDLNTVLFSFVIPCVLYADVLAYFILKFIIARFSAFKLKTKRAAM